MKCGIIYAALTPTGKEFDVNLEKWLESGRNLAVWAVLCIATVLTVDGYLVYRVHEHAAKRGTTVTLQETVLTNIEPRCPEPKVIIIKSGQLDVPIG
jgi:hypothetical protein